MKLTKYDRQLFERWVPNFAEKEHLEVPQKGNDFNSDQEIEVDNDEEVVTQMLGARDAMVPSQVIREMSRFYQDEKDD